jgi:cytochrome b pre-mRNA-processing protein 3
MLKSLFRRRAARLSIEQLYARAAAQARTPDFYLALGAPDRIDARFELYTLHVLLLVMRLRDEGPAGADAAQDLFDTYVSALDHALRELGVGDLSIAKKMRKLGESLYGRMTAYEAPLRAGNVDDLAQALARNLFEDEAAPGAPAIAAYAVASRARLAAQPVEALQSGPDWAEISA